MESITGDLFATKGVEYLVVIAYLIVLVGFWRLLARPGPATPEHAGTSPSAGGPFQVRDDLYYHQGHSWAAPEEPGVVRVGMDDFAVRMLGTPDAIGLPAVGTRLKQGRRGWAVEVGSKCIPLVSPVEGEVVELNLEARSEPEKLAADPYGAGWLMKIKLGGRDASLKNLLSGTLARSWMEQTLEKLRAMRAGELGIVMPDGGIPIDGFIRVLAPESWDEVAREFLLSGEENSEAPNRAEARRR